MPSGSKKKEEAQTRRLRFDGNYDSVDMRAVVGFDPTKKDEWESEEALNFVFYPPSSKVNPRLGAKQFREGVEMTEDQAMEILTSPYRAWGFSDISHLFNPDGTVVDTGEGLTATLPPNEGFLEVAPMAPLNAEEARQFAASAAAQTPEPAEADTDGGKGGN